MRKLLNAVFSLSFGFGGLWLLYMQVFVWGYVHGMALLAVGVLLAVGFGWFWIDILRPAITGQEEE